MLCFTNYTLNEMENAILLHNKHWQKTPYDIPIQRDLLKKLLRYNTAKEIQIISGIRRSGKSSLLKLYINELIKTVNPLSILFVNFDDPNFSGVYQQPQNIYNIVEIAERLTQTKINYLLFDEIQMVDGWEKYVKSIYDADAYKKICITGSNAKLLNSNYSKLLSGRYITHQIYPLSLNEIFTHYNLDNKLAVLQNKPDVFNMLDHVMKYGSFPEIINKSDQQLKHEIATNYFDSILVKDCIVNKNIRDSKSFKELSFYLFTNISSLYSYNSISKATGINDISVKEYINTMSDSFLIYEIAQFSYKVRQQIKSKRKMYCIDNGLISAVSLNFSENKGKLFENLVFSEIIKSGCKEIFFYNENKECDFLIKKKNKLIAIQVCYEINKTNKEREILGLEEVMKTFSIDKSFIITFLQSEKVNKNISVIPIYEMSNIFE